MDYEKKYKEALERAREWYNKTEPDSYTCIVESIFPELKESQDERIRKALIRYFTLSDEHAYNEACGVSYRDILAWLEKQYEKKSTDNMTQQEAMDIAVAKCFNEQKVADKVEPKFKVGDTIKYVGERKELAADEYPIKEICNDCYITTYGNKIPFRMQEYYVIVNDTKELKKIETSLPSFDEAQGTPVITYNKEHYQNAAWSEEDERLYRELHNLIYSTPYCDSRKELSNWLESLKQRATWKPSVKQVKALRWVLNNIPYNKHKEEISLLLDQIKDL